MNWLVTEDIFEAMEAARHGENAPTAAELLAYEERSVDAAGPDDAPRIMSMVGKTASININGVLTSRPNFFAQFFGGGNTTYSEINKAVALAEANPDIEETDIFINSGGGEASTAWLETMEIIAATKKPVNVFVGDLAASAAYGIASQADTITAQNKLSKVGSVGVVQTFHVNEGVTSVTSTNAPNKRPDIKTEEGRATVRKDLDQTETVFINAIAEGRGTTAADVQDNFGRGGVVYALEAVEKGMIDGMLEPTAIATKPATNGKIKTEALNMDLNELKAKHPDLYAQAAAAGATEALNSEKERIEAHLVLGEASGDMETAMAAIKSGDQITPLITAKHQAAGIKATAAAARIKDENDLDTGDAGTSQPSALSEEDQVFEACANLSTDAGEFYE